MVEGMTELRTDGQPDRPKSRKTQIQYNPYFFKSVAIAPTSSKRGYEKQYVFNLQ